MAPRLVQSLFAAFGDLYLYKLSKLIFNGQVAKWTVSLNSFMYLYNFLREYMTSTTLDVGLNKLFAVIFSVG
jgi:GPI mannosyltransferase 3